MTFSPLDRRLYETDWNLWLLTTIKQLKNRDFESVDIEHLIEELDSLARRDRRELKSRLRVLVTHLLTGCLKSRECHVERSDSEAKHLSRPTPNRDSSLRSTTLRMTKRTFQMSSKTSLCS
ncbi:DUF29 domain-containing protein [Pleurocapsales cyanobacterium LEGE 06147]|nr:DUF29 domain-containing protein [Pleurocapsales cyanobacterium LEGE 06147]